jgi:hypothetical protein
MRLHGALGLQALHRPEAAPVGDVEGDETQAGHVGHQRKVAPPLGKRRRGIPGCIV